WVTLFHWDLPQALQDKYAGWESKETPRRFADYAAFMANRLSDRVSHFFTINEFLCFTDLGYTGSLVYPPAKLLPAKGLNQVRHNALLAHGLGVGAVRGHARGPVCVGLAENAIACVPVMETVEHVAAARAAMRERNRHFLTPVMEGRYPESYLKAEGADAPEFSDAEMKAIGSKLDFVGINAYSPSFVRADASPAGFAAVPFAASHPTMNIPWLRPGPSVAYWTPRLMKEVWGVDHVVLSENGCCSDDRVAEDGQIYDTDRLTYLRDHFVWASRAVAEGWPLKGYFVWSLLDNFEWSYGYTKRFGLFYTNYQTQERTPKLSAKFYREVIAQGKVV
ncbi:MAG TPA: family 1 glycosylhydrolase, partial [Candidatus Brocadiia bacterium]|nr:family 1 glycosylhydrolase [Candidatus Brocadiia bacterium]